MFGQPVVIVLATAHKLFVGKMKLCTQEAFLEDVLTWESEFPQEGVKE